MKGRLVALTRPTDDDFRRIEQWLQPGAPAAPLAGSPKEFVTAEVIRDAHRRGAPYYLIIETITDQSRIGIVTYRSLGDGRYAVGGALGEQELWHHGYAGDACTVLVDYLFHICNARKVETTVQTYSEASVRMLAKAGFVCEGILREHTYLDGRWHDAVMWSMLRREFYALYGPAGSRAGPGGQLAVKDLVPEQDKARARHALAEHLRSAPDTTSIGMFLDTKPDPEPLS